MNAFVAKIFRDCLFGDVPNLVEFFNRWIELESPEVRGKVNLSLAGDVAAEDF